MDCTSCQVPMKMMSEATARGVGCVIMLLGFLFSPFLLGLPIVVYGIYQFLEQKNFLQCSQCGRQILKGKSHPGFGLFVFFAISACIAFAALVIYTILHL